MGAENGTIKDSSLYQQLLQEDKKPSLGERNPLIFPGDWENPEVIRAISMVTRQMIASYGGEQPEIVTTAAPAGSYRIEKPRLVVKFEVDKLTPAQLAYLEGVVQQIYQKSVKGRSDTTGSNVKVSGYVPLEKEPSDRKKDKKDRGQLLGWYIGPCLGRLDNTDVGLLVHRDLGESSMAEYLKSHSPSQWFYNTELCTPLGKPIDKRYQVEIREGGPFPLYQTDVVEFALQVAHILAKGEPLKHPAIKYEIYNALNRLGINPVTKESIYGLDDILATVEQCLVLPLANLGLSSGMDLRAESVLLAGVPGTGKTLIAEYLLQRDNGVFLTPLVPSELLMELAQPAEKKTMLPRLSNVFKQTGIPVVLHIDDIEDIAKDAKDGGNITKPTLLNLMRGVRESGFYLLASTNHPEEISPQLLQPQRFGRMVHCPLPDEFVRMGILNIHALERSMRLGIPLFSSDEAREDILRAVATHTHGFTSRFLAAICTEAKSILLQRIATVTGQTSGLTEEHLEGQQFTPADWDTAYNNISRRYDRKSMVERDKEIAEFVDKYNQKSGIGLVKTVQRYHSPILQTVADLTAARAMAHEQPLTTE